MVLARDGVGQLGPGVLVPEHSHGMLHPGHVVECDHGQAGVGWQVVADQLLGRLVDPFPVLAQAHACCCLNGEHVAHTLLLHNPNLGDDGAHWLIVCAYADKIRVGLDDLVGGAAATQHQLPVGHHGIWLSGPVGATTATRKHVGIEPVSGVGLLAENTVAVLQPALH